jgi:hypothetical protein
MSPGSSRGTIGTNEGGLSQSPPIFIFVEAGVSCAMLALTRQALAGMTQFVTGPRR